jgi:putative Ig domain-containing protein
MRILRWTGLFVALAGVFAGAALALDFDDEDPEPPHAEIGLIYSYEIGSHAGCLPHRLEIVSGQLPPGLSIRRIDLDTHVVEGVATETGIFSAWIHLRDCDNKSAEALFKFDVWPRRWGIATQSLKPASLGSPYSFALEGEGLPSDVTWEVTAGSLPAGLVLSPAGTISGTATAVGSSTLTVKATAKEKNFGPTRIDSRQFTLTVASRLGATLSSQRAEVGRPIRAAVALTGGVAPYTVAVTGLPAGLRFDSGQNVITGVPRKAGSFALKATITDASKAVQPVEFRLTVARKLTIVTTRLPGATFGHAYSVRIRTIGGVGVFAWTISAGRLPQGLRLNARTGTIAGTPRSAGTSAVTLRVRDTLGAVSTRKLRLSVNA